MAFTQSPSYSWQLDCFSLVRTGQHQISSCLSHHDPDHNRILHAFAVMRNAMKILCTKFGSKSVAFVTPNELGSIIIHRLYSWLIFGFGDNGQIVSNMFLNFSSSRLGFLFLSEPSQISIQVILTRQSQRAMRASTVDLPLQTRKRLCTVAVDHTSNDLHAENPTKHASLTSISALWRLQSSKNTTGLSPRLFPKFAACGVWYSLQLSSEYSESPNPCPVSKHDYQHHRFEDRDVKQTHIYNHQLTSELSPSGDFTRNVCTMEATGSTTFIKLVHNPGHVELVVSVSSLRLRWW